MPLTTIVMIIIIFSLLTASLTITFAIRTVSRQRKGLSQRKTILTNGTSAQAVIHSIQQTNAQLGNQPEVLLDLTVTMPDGEFHHTIVKTFIPIVNIPSFQKGCVVEVKYMTIAGEPKFEVVGAYVP
ncbi:hypothetical protein [Paenibacillus sp. VMFN-D1]|uniref:hypothetical protein n=1 Tax=Paenibacillus sp. VMFN-D1 TaxID=2135608 RepID=UPI00216359E9|nr:hypothetical protein [Paenibacillus sp. VMFN-D1]